MENRIGVLRALAALLLSTSLCGASAASKAAPEAPLNEDGKALLARYTALLSESHAEIVKSVPKIDESKNAAFQKAREATKAAETAANGSQAAQGKIQTAKALVEHAKGKWIGGAEKGIAQAEAALKKATTDAERDAAKKDLAKWQADKEAGLKALKERQDALNKATVDEADVKAANQKSQANLAQARAQELAAAQAILTTVDPFLTSDKLDAALTRCAVLTEATPRGLAEFAQQGKEQTALVDKLLADTALMKQMLEAGGAQGGKYGRAMQILTDIQ